MTQEEKQLLLKDLCARLPYWSHVKTVDDDDAYIVGLDDTEEGLFYIHILEDGDSYDVTMSVENFKPYLRPMSSITAEEKKEFDSLMNKVEERCINAYGKGGYTLAFTELNDWLNKKMFDYRGLIPMGLALEATKGMYKDE